MKALIDFKKSNVILFRILKKLFTIEFNIVMNISFTRYYVQNKKTYFI